MNWRELTRSVVGRGRGETASPTFFDRGTRPPRPPLFWIEIRAKESTVATGYLLKRSVG